MRKAMLAGMAVITAASAAVAAWALSTRTTNKLVEPARHTVEATIPTTTSTTVPVTTTTTVPPTTTTTVPPTTTTTVAFVTVPNVQEAAEGSLGQGENAVQQAGLVYQIDRVDSGACWFTGPGGDREWNTNAIVSQYPDPGQQVPGGTTVTLQVC